MRTSISNKTQKFLQSLENKNANEVVNYYGDLDEIDTLIYKNGLRIEGVDFYPHLDLMLVVLNNKKVLKRDLSDFERLKYASVEELENYEFIGEGIGVHWPNVDEDLSLKGFLKYEIAHIDQPLVA